MPWAWETIKCAMILGSQLFLISLAACPLAIMSANELLKPSEKPLDQVCDVRISWQHLSGGQYCETTANTFAPRRQIRIPY